MSTENYTQFQKDLIVSEGALNKGMYNLVTTIRDLKIWTAGYKDKLPSSFKLKYVKKYFGFTNHNADQMLNTLLLWKLNLNELQKEHQNQ